jgi:UPF0271 protein
MGEIPEDIAMMPYVTSANIACGGHAGDEQTMTTTIEEALRWKVAVGAHPSYPDRANFGRLELNMPPEAIADAVFKQVRAFAAVAGACGAEVTHVKPHGALYNQAAGDRGIAAAIAAGVARQSHEVVLVGLAGSVMLDAFREAGFAVAAEAFADRRYEPDGSLRSRKFEDALIRDPAQAAQQALRIANQGRAQTICIHGDTPGAVRIAQAVAQALREAGIELRGLAK